MKKVFVLAGAITIIALSSFTLTHDGKTGSTGSPGELNCTECHSDYAANIVGGSVTFSSNIPDNIYTPGKTYEITVTVERKGAKLFGLGVEALLNTNNKNAGTFIITNKAETQIVTANVNNDDRNNLIHQTDGGKTNDSKSFKFNWTAPATDAGNLTFYVSSLAANADESPSGDYCYTTSQVIKSASAKNENTVKSPANETTYTKETFGFTKVLNGQSVDVVEKGNMNMIISHHFGAVNTGAYGFFGLDQGTIRIGLEYGIINGLSVEIGRSEYNKTFDGAIKYKILKQCKGEKNMPVTLDVYVGSSLNSMKWTNTNQTNYFSSRLSYVYQLLVARNFGDKLSLQLSPTMIHNNLALGFKDPNDIFALGSGVRYKLNKHLALSGEYYYLIPNQLDKSFKSEMAIGLDIQTAKHVFQLQFTNTQPMFEKGFITETTGRVNKGDIYFGFNISRTFRIVK